MSFGVSLASAKAFLTGSIVRATIGRMMSSYSARFSFQVPRFPLSVSNCTVSFIVSRQSVFRNDDSFP